MSRIDSQYNGTKINLQQNKDPELGKGCLDKRN
jgi:hypothetical protein